MKNIVDVAKKLNIDSNNLELYGNYMAKVNLVAQDKKAKLILVTAISPTKYGEGKTTVSIGLHDSLCKLGKKSLAVLREPSLGPVFGMKGGACGGGKATILPDEDINLHFTGDFHAITAANNLLASAIYNHIYQGNLLNIDENRIEFKRCLDVNDRALRDDFNIITVVLGADTKKMRTRDSIKLIEYTYQNYELIDLKEIVENAFQNWQEINEKRIKIYKGEKETPQTMFGKLIYGKYPVLKTEKNNILVEMSSALKMEAPVEKNSKIGEAKVMLNTTEIMNVDILIKEKIKRKSCINYYKELLQLYQ